MAKRQQIPYCVKKNIPICCSAFLIKTNPRPTKVNNVIKVNITYKYTLTGKGTKKLLQHLDPTVAKTSYIPVIFMDLAPSLFQDNDKVCPKTDTLTHTF